MSQIIAVTAGKGGTGKSTTSANVATALAALGKKTLVVELDFGLRCLDIMLGIKDKVKHDIGEYLEGKIDILTATTKVDRVDNLYLVCATRNPFISPNSAPMRIITGIVAQSGIICFVKRCPATTEDAIHTVPIERSMPPVAITNVTPSAKIA